MRTLSTGLLTAQRALTGTPAVSVTVGATDYSSRLKQYLYQERPYGGLATIVLDNHDKAITADFRGNKVVIGNGFTGQDYSNAPSLWVLTQTDVSREGELRTQLLCIDIWQKLSLLRVIGGGGVELKGTVVGTFQPGMTVTGQTSGAKAIVLGAGTGFIWIGRVAKGPFTVGEVVKADLYPTSQITLASVTDLGGGSSPAWAGDKTVLQIIQQLCVGVVTVVLDSSDGIVDVYKPTYATDANTPYLGIIQDLMNMTKCGIRAGNDDKLHIFDISSAPGSPDYSYDSVHKFITELRDVSAILPNKIIVINAEQVGTGVTPYYGEAKDTAAITQFGMEIPQVIFADVQSNADATLVATSRLNRIQKEAVRGTVEVPIMNCGQELFDYIRITDVSAGLDFYGWVGSIERRYDWDAGVYSLIVGLGGLVGAVGLPAGADYPLPNVEQPPVPPPSEFVPTPYSPGPGEQAYIAEVKFTSTAYNSITWTAGSIKLADGRVQSINAGSLTLTTTHYIYCVWGNPILQNSTNYGAAVGSDRMLVAVASKASTTDQLAYVNNPFTDSILINRDKVMDGLVNELKLANEAVTSLKIGPSAVTITKIADDSISTPKLRALSVVAEKIQTGAVVAEKIAAAAVTAIKIDAAAVDATKIAAGAVTADKIYAGAVTAVKLAAEIILATVLKAGSVTLDALGVHVLGSTAFELSYSGANKAYIFVDSAGRVYINPALYGGERTLFVNGVVVVPQSGGFIFGTTQIAKEGSIKIKGASSGDIYIYSGAAWRTNT